MIRILFSLSLGVALVSGHSWLVCTDYRGSVLNYENSKCQAWPRNFHGYGVKEDAFGWDVAFNYEGRTGTRGPCQKEGISPNPKEIAKYAPGGIYCLAWPSKNHVAQANSLFYPDGGLGVFRGNTNNPNPSQAEFSKNPVATNFGIHRWGKSDCLGFQRVPDYESSIRPRSDRSLGSGCIKIDDDLPEGKYTFQWFWIFLPSPSPPTIMCWDAEVSKKNDKPTSVPMAGFTTVKDSLRNGGNTCRENWAKNSAFTKRSGLPAGRATHILTSLNSDDFIPTVSQETAFGDLEHITNDQDLDEALQERVEGFSNNESNRLAIDRLVDYPTDSLYDGDDDYPNTHLSDDDDDRSDYDNDNDDIDRAQLYDQLDREAVHEQYNEKVGKLKKLERKLKSELVALRAIKRNRLFNEKGGRKSRSIFNDQSDFDD